MAQGRVPSRIFWSQMKIDHLKKHDSVFQKIYCSYIY